MPFVIGNARRKQGPGQVLSFETRDPFPLDDKGELHVISLAELAAPAAGGEGGGGSAISTPTSDPDPPPNPKPNPKLSRDTNLYTTDQATADTRVPQARRLLGRRPKGPRREAQETGPSTSRDATTPKPSLPRVRLSPVADRQSFSHSRFLLRPRACFGWGPSRSTDGS